MTKFSTTNKDTETPNKSESNSEYVNISAPTGTYSDSIHFPVKNSTNDSYNVSLTTDDIADFTAKAREHFNSNKNKPQINQLIMLLNMLGEGLKGYDLKLPKVRVSLAENNSLGLSWHIGSANFGATILEDINDSSWFLLQGGTRGYRADGYLADPDFKMQLPNLISFLINHRF